MSITTTLNTEADVTWITGDEVTAPERRILNLLWQQGPVLQTDVPDEPVATLSRRGMVLVIQGRVHLTERGSRVLTACKGK